MLCVWLTADDMRAPPASCRDWICLDFPVALFPGIAWSFVGLFGVAGAAIIGRRVWRPALRAVLYVASVFVAGALALPIGFLVGSAMSPWVKDRQMENANALLRTAVVLRGWSSTPSADGGLDVVADFTAGRSGEFAAYVETDAVDCPERDTRRIHLSAMANASFQWHVTCASHPSLRVEALSFCVNEPRAALTPCVVFRRGARDADGNGVTLVVPLPGT